MLVKNMVVVFTKSHVQISSCQMFEMYMFLLFSDFTVRVVEVESSRHKVYRGHKAPVLSVALDPKEEFVVGIFYFL